MPHALPLFAALLFLQEQGPRPPAVESPPAAETAKGRDQGWTLVNRVAVVINEDIITLRDVFSRVRHKQSRGQATTEIELREAERSVLRDEIRHRLQVQAGQDLGVPREVLEHQVDSVMEREIESAGGVSALSERLNAQSTASFEQRELLSERLYSSTWERIVTGEQPGLQGRATSDRFVRPGMRLLVYRAVLESPERYGDFGGTAPEYVFQLLAVRNDASGEGNSTRDFVGELRELALEGDDFGALIERHGAVTGDRSVVRVARAQLGRADPAFVRFLEQGSPGDISPVHETSLVDERGREVPAWAVARLAERVAAAAPEFRTPVVQQKLQDFAERSFDARRHEDALLELYRAAYVWPPEFARR